MADLLEDSAAAEKLLRGGLALAVLVVLCLAGTVFYMARRERAGQPVFQRLEDMQEQGARNKPEVFVQPREVALSRVAAE